MAQPTYPKKEFFLPCDCHCGVIGFEADPEDEIFITYFESNFSSQQRPFKTAIKERIKMIWCALFSKRYRLFEVVILKERLSEFKEWVKDI